MKAIFCRSLGLGGVVAATLISVAADLTGPKLLVTTLRTSDTDVFIADPKWRRVEQESQKDGTLRSGAIAYKLSPTDFSSLK